MVQAPTGGAGGLTDSCAADIMRVADESYDGFILPQSSLLIFTASVSLAFNVAWRAEVRLVRQRERDGSVREGSWRRAARRTFMSLILACFALSPAFARRSILAVCAAMSSGCAAHVPAAAGVRGSGARTSGRPAPARRACGAGRGSVRCAPRAGSTPGGTPQTPAPPCP